jgi:hypothetical protein
MSYVCTTFFVTFSMLCPASVVLHLATRQFADRTQLSSSTGGCFGEVFLCRLNLDSRLLVVFCEIYGHQI